MIRADDMIGKVINTVPGFVEIEFTDGRRDILPTTKVQDLVKRFTLESLQGVSVPSSNDIKLISKYQPLGSDPVSATDTKVVTLLAADNMLDRSLARWNPKDLRKLATLPVGFPLLLNHDAENVGTTQGVVFDSGIIEFNTVPHWLTNTSANTSYNRQLAKTEGYIGLILRAALPATSPTIDALSYGMGGVSLGYSFHDIHCPLCGTSFYDESCPHGVPLSHKHQTDSRYAPWREKVNPFDVYEVSIVAEPNLPRASILRGMHAGLLPKP